MASPGASAGQRPSRLSHAEIARQKRAAATLAAEMVKDGMRVGLGTGSTVAPLLEALGERQLSGVRCVATSPATERRARALGLTVQGLDELGELDLAIDGADQIDPLGWLVKGGGGAHTREKIVACAARSFVVIASANKAVAQLSPPVPLELMRYGVQSTLRGLGDARLRPPHRGAELASSGEVQESPDGGLIADYFGPLDDPRALAASLSATPGLVEHGLFAPELVSVILIAGQDGVERREGRKQA
jgi:ribose 5-phosphate isomerase A